MKNKCHNCKHAGKAFKIGKVTHMHCQHPEERAKSESAWDTLTEFYSTCKKHESKVEYEHLHRR